MKCHKCGESFMFPSYRPRGKVISVPKNSPSDSGEIEVHDIGWFDAGCPHCGSSTKHKRWCSDQQIIDAYKDLHDVEEDKTCENYETLGDGIECIHYNEEVYSAGTSRYCRFFRNDVYYLKTKNCFHRGTYSDDVQSPEVKQT